MLLPTGFRPLLRQWMTLKSAKAESRDLKIAAMRALDAGSTGGEIARKYQLSPKLLERWRGEWRAKGELAFPGIGRRNTGTRSNRRTDSMIWPRCSNAMN